MNMNRPIWPTSYSPSPRVPKWFSKDLWKFGGSNSFGGPIYRVVWAMDARTFRNGNPNAMKYPNPNDVNLGYACFWLERYAQPEFFNEVHWRALRYGACEQGTGKIIDYMGPFPQRGDYIGVAPLVKDSDEDDMPYEMLPLSRDLLDELMHRLSPNSLTDKMSAEGIVAAQERLKKAKSAAIVEKKLEETYAYYRTNAEKINAEHSRTYTGLKTFKPSPAQALLGSQIAIPGPTRP